MNAQYARIRIAQIGLRLNAITKFARNVRRVKIKAYSNNYFLKRLFE